MKPVFCYTWQFVILNETSFLLYLAVCDPECNQFLVILASLWFWMKPVCFVMHASCDSEWNQLLVILASCDSEWNQLLVIHASCDSEWNQLLVILASCDSESNQFLADIDVSESLILEHLSHYDKTDTSLVVTATVHGERHNPSERGATVSNITASNTSLREVYCAVSCGIIANLRAMMSETILTDAGIMRIVGTGSALARNRVLQHEVSSQFRLPLILHEDCNSDAAVGAALAVVSRCSRSESKR